MSSLFVLQPSCKFWTAQFRVLDCTIWVLDCTNWLDCMLRISPATLTKSSSHRHVYLLCVRCLMSCLHDSDIRTCTSSASSGVHKSRVLVNGLRSSTCTARFPVQTAVPVIVTVSWQWPEPWPQSNRYVRYKRVRFSTAIG